MRVGVVFANSSPSRGGGSTFESTIFNHFSRHVSNHEFVLLDQSCNLLPNDKLVHPSLPLSHAQDLPGKSLALPLVLLGKLKRIAKKVVLKLSPGRISGTSKHTVQDKLNLLQLDLLWYVSPFAWNVSLPYLITVWDLEHRKQPWFPEVSNSGWTWDQRESFYRDSLPKASAVVVGTETGKNEVIRFYNVSAGNVVVNPFPVPHMINARNIERENIPDHLAEISSHPFFVYPAQFWPHKNHYALLHAFNTVCAKCSSKPKLVLTGADKGNLTYIKSIARSLGVIDDVVFAGFVSAELLAYLYKTAVALVYPSFFGPDNLPPLEAMLHSCPVIAADIPGVSDQLEDCALLFNPNDYDRLAELMLSFLRDPGLRNEYIIKGNYLASLRQVDSYFQTIECCLDTLEGYTRCWDRNYVHT